MLVASTLRVSLSSLLSGGHHDKCGFTVVKLRFSQHRWVARWQLQRNFSPKFAIDSQVGSANDFGEKSLENRLRMWFSTDIGFEIDLGCVFASIFRSWGCFWELLGAFGRPWELPWPPWGASRGGSEAFGAPRRSPETLQGAPWEPLGLPWGSQDRSGRVLTSQNHENSMDFARFLHHFRSRKR